jgi:hypothetical protein
VAPSVAYKEIAKLPLLSAVMVWGAEATITPVALSTSVLERENWSFAPAIGLPSVSTTVPITLTFVKAITYL